MPVPSLNLVHPFSSPTIKISCPLENLDITVEVKSQDEFGELAASFSEMINILKNYIQDLAKVLGSIEKGNLDVAKILQEKIK